MWNALSALAKLHVYFIESADTIVLLDIGTGEPRVATLKDVLAAKIPAERQRAKDFVKQHGAQNIDQVSVEQVYGGMRGISCLLCDTSSVPADKGLIIRGRPIAELAHLLP